MGTFVERSGRNAAGELAHDSGMSLVELLVAMVIMGVVLSLLGVAFNSDTKTTRAVNQHTNSTADAQIAMESITRHLRVAITPGTFTSPFVAANTSTTSVSVYSSWVTDRTAPPSTTLPAPTRYTYALDPTHNNCLAEWITPAIVANGNYTWPVADGPSHCLATGQVSVAFAYYDTGTSTTPITDLTIVDSVGVTVTVAASASDPNPVTLTDRVTLPNLGSTA